MLLSKGTLRHYDLRVTPFDRLAHSNSLAVAKVRQRFPYRKPKKGYSSLHFGQFSLSAFGIADNWPSESAKSVDQDALLLDLGTSVVHSIVGLIETQSQELVADTLVHTVPARDGYHYTTTGDVQVNAPSLHLPGTWIHCLLGNDENYFHYTLMNIARLGLIDEETAFHADGLLLPRPRTSFQVDIVKQLKKYFTDNGMPKAKLAFHEIDVWKSISTDDLIVPWNVASDWGAHHRGISFLRSLFKSQRNGPGNRCIYIDRRRARNRTLINEDDVVNLMKKFGFEIVDLASLSVTAQVELFSDCCFIVGPHGAGLTNLVFAPPGAAVLEILPDQLLNWCYRSISNSCNLHYDCILSRSFADTRVGPTWAPTIASLDHIASSVEDLMRRLNVSSR